MKTALVLFDIDSTLLHSGGAGVAALRRALKQRFGRDDDLEKITIAGQTDSGIARQLFALHDIEPSAENLASFLDEYLVELKRLLPATSGELLPGVVELLEKLRALPHVALGLLTGNLLAGARLKLEHYGVWHFFEFGAYADDHHDRNQLGPFAQKRATELHDCDFDPARTFVIGDTPHDVACGKAIAAKTVAVATGDFSVEELEKAGADFVFGDLADTEKVVRTLRLLRESS